MSASFLSTFERLKLCIDPSPYADMADSTPREAKATTKIKLDSAWRADMAGKEVEGGQATTVKAQDDSYEKEVVSRATDEADGEVQRQADALREMSIKAIGQATGPTTAPATTEPSAPPLRPKSSKRRPSSSGSRYASSGSSSSSSRPRRRRRSPTRSRRGRSTTPRPRAGSPQPMQVDQMMWYAYRIKFAQVVDDTRFDLGAIFRKFGQIWQASPTILEFRSEKTEEEVVTIMDESIDRCFRVFYRNGTFTVRLAPRHEQRGRRGRKSNPKPKPKAAPRAAQAQTMKQRQKAEPKAKPRARLTPAPPVPKPSYCSGALDSPQHQPQRRASPKASSAQMPAPWVRQEPRRAPAGARATSPPLNLDRPKKQPRVRPSQALEEGSHNHQVVDLLRSVANLIEVPRPSTGPLRILDMRSHEI